MDIIQLISQYGVVGILFYFGIKEGFAYLNKKDKLEADEKKDFGLYGREIDAEVSKLKSQMVGIETKMINVEFQLDKIANNHLEHLKNDIIDIRLSVAKICTKLGIED
jgi:hypothetical protein